jgi:general L-amino acid transport system permease protein
MSGTTSDPRYKRRPPKRPLRLSWSDERVRGIFWPLVA